VVKAAGVGRSVSAATVPAAVALVYEAKGVVVVHVAAAAVVAAEPDSVVKGVDGLWERARGPDGLGIEGGLGLRTGDLAGLDI